MEKILLVEKYLNEWVCSKTGYLHISNFLKTNVTSSSDSTCYLIERCKQYLSHNQWMKENSSSLKNYGIMDKNGKIHNDKWLNKIAKMYIDEPGMKITTLIT